MQSQGIFLYSCVSDHLSAMHQVRSGRMVVTKAFREWLCKGDSKFTQNVSARGQHCEPDKGALYQRESWRVLARAAQLQISIG